ncbi:hypothetical protein [Methylomonas fluvii]|uniref:Methyl-accepting transducer domain-containing protein n=1 Tax=Methylomonas fluvii TaxID=1854564 RepID=A0ABR9DF98_9GAMM|nr:hypothetical protein [Methylomonas fluvii]MBD9361770.1 hypothetical protein [Methylomonas fluvii]
MTDKMHTPRMKPVRSFYDKYLFGLVFGIGTAGIVGLKYFQIPQIYVTAFPVALMCVYAAILFKVRERRLSEDQSGDNLYYLGFLYTLVSLSYALYNFTSSTEQSPATTSIDPIINSFGIALATTIVGLMFRIIFNQMRHDIVDVEAEARIELANAATRLRTELDQITLDMNHFGRATKQSIAEGLQAVSQEASDAMSQSATKFGEVAEMLGSRMNKTLDGFVQNTEQLNITSSGMVVAIESLLKRVENIEAPTDLITTKIAPAMEAIKEAGEAINKRASGDGKVLARLTTAIENAVASSSLLEQNVSALNAVAVQAQENMVTLNKSADIGNSILSSISQTVAEAQKLTQEHVNALHEVKQSLGGTSTVMSSLIASWQAEVDAAIVLISQKGSEAKNNIEQSINDLKGQEIRAIQEMASSAETILETVRKHSDELDKELEKSRKSTIQVHAGLNEIIDEISARLQSETVSRQAQKIDY